ncbi:vWA domain-containing protein [Hydrogenimonas sp.]
MGESVVSFLNPFFLWLLIPLGLLTLLRYRQERLARLPLHPKVVLQNGRTLAVRLAPYGALAWMLVALARPVLPEEAPRMADARPTLFLAIDASRSMRARDLAPDRYTFAKEAIETLVRSDPSRRYALVAFTTNALLLSPPTVDGELITAALESFNPDYILTRGTSFEALLKYVARFAGERKELAIFSDGGDGEDLGGLVRLARELGIRIVGVACATERGAKVPTEDGWLHDAAGRLVISRLNPAFEALALESGGAFVEESDPRAAAEAVSASLALEVEGEREERVRYKELFWVPLGLGIAFFLYGTIAPNFGRRWRWRR